MNFEQPDKTELNQKEIKKDRKDYEKQTNESAREKDGGLLEQFKKRIKGEETTDPKELMMDDAEKENVDREMDRIIDRVDPEILNEFFKARDVATKVAEEFVKESDSDGEMLHSAICEIIEKAAKENKMSESLIKMNLSESRGGAPQNYGCRIRLAEKEFALPRIDAAFELGGVLHDDWRKTFKKDNPNDPDRFKPVKDEKWVKKCEELCTEQGNVTINRNTEKQQTIEVKKSPDGKIAIGEDGKVYLDILNSSYNELSNDWKGENKESAEVAVSEIASQTSMSKRQSEFNHYERDDVSEEVHKQWLKRNPWAPENQQKPFSELSEEEKDKDRTIVDKAYILYEKRLKEMHLIKKI